MEQLSNSVGQGSSRWAIAGLSLTMLMPSFATSAANVALPDLAKMFDASFQAAQWIVLSYLLSITALVAVIGRLGDILGRRRLLLAGTAVFAAGSTLSGIAPSIELLIVARVLQGIGAATMMPLAIAFVSAVVSPTRTGSAMGLLGSMSAIGTTLGPALGGLLTAWAGSRAIFLVNVPLAVLASLIASRTLPADPPRTAATSSRFDVAGIIFLATALGAYTLAMTLGRGGFGPLNVVILVIAFALGTAFVAIEARVPHPLVRLDLFSNRALVTGLSTNMIVSTVMMATLIVGPFFLGKVIGFGPAAAGLVLAVGPVVAAMTGIPAGRLVDRCGSDRAALVGIAALAAGAAALSVVPSTLGTAGYIVPVVMMTIGYALFQAANNAKIMMAATDSDRGLVAGILNLSRNLGLVTGASTMGAIFAWGTATHDVVAASPGAVVVGMHSTFAVAAVLLAGCLLASIGAALGDQKRVASPTG